MKPAQAAALLGAAGAKPDEIPALIAALAAGDAPPQLHSRTSVRLRAVLSAYATLHEAGAAREVSGPKGDTPASAHAVVHAAIGCMLQEHFLALLYDVQWQLLGDPVTVAIGTVSGTHVHPRDVFRSAIVRNASGVIIAHNHPSGIATPSKDDCTLTKRLCEAGQLVGIPVVDHVITTPSGTFVSFRQLGLMG